MPSDREIEDCIRKEVLRAPLDAATVSSIRKAVEAELGLGDSFLKQGDWKTRSKQLIVETFDQRNGEPDGSEANENASKSKQKASQLDKKPQSQDKKPQSQDKKSQSHDKKPQPKTSKQDKNQAPESESEPELDPDIELSDDMPDEETAKPSGSAKKRRSKPESAAPKKRTKKAPATKKSSQSSKDDEIAKLKSQLLKCGVRKQWNKILAAMDSDAERVRHLKDQLADLGMTGRFSLAKAKQIKEEREYAREMMELQEEADRVLDSDVRRGGRRSGAPDRTDGSGGQSDGSDSSDAPNGSDGQSDQDKEEKPKPRKNLKIMDSDEE